MNSNQKIYNIGLYVLMGLSAILSVLFFLDVLSVGQILGWCAILLGAAVVVSIVFPIIVMLKNPKKAKTALFGILGLGIIFAISYAMSGSEVYKLDGDEISEAVSKGSEAGLIMFYILVILAIGSIVFSEVSKAFK